MPEPIELFFWATPDCWKIMIALEEMALPYAVRPVVIGRGEQFEPTFLAISSNNRVPAIADRDSPDGRPAAIFESGGILQYLGRKTGRFYPREGRAAWTPSNGCSGRLAASARCSDRRATSATMRRHSSKTPY